MKVALVYTSTTPELIELVEKELRKNIGEEAELLSYSDPSILEEVKEHGCVTAQPAARLIKMYMQAVTDGADAILNICSSVGEVADCARDLADYIGVPIVRIDEEMCRDAVRKGSRIGILATLQTTLEPTKNTVKRVAREIGREITLTDGLVEGGFGADQDVFKNMLLEKAREIVNDVDVILLAQGSMAYAEQYLEKNIGKPVLSSPRYGAAELRKALVKKGLIIC